MADIFHEPREFSERQAESAQQLQLLLPDGRGYALGGFALVWVANAYMSAFAHLRLSVKDERLELKQEVQKLEESGTGPRSVREGRRLGKNR